MENAWRESQRVVSRGNSARLERRKEVEKKNKKKLYSRVARDAPVEYELAMYNLKKFGGDTQRASLAREVATYVAEQSSSVNYN